MTTHSSTFAWKIPWTEGLGTLNVASAAEKRNLKFYFILNGHVWLVAMILDHIAVESNNFQNSIRKELVSFREEESECQ